MQTLPGQVCHPAPVALLPDLIDAQRIELRRWRPTYAAALCDAVASSLPELRLWMPWAQEDPTVEGHVAVLEQGDIRFEIGDEWQFLMVEPETGRVVGATGLHPRLGAGNIEIGYWVRTDATHQGFATMAARALTTAAFDHLSDVDVVQIRMDTGNHRSAAVPPRLGFQLEGEVEQVIDAPGQSGRWLVWTMDRTGWNPLRS